MTAAHAQPRRIGWIRWQYLCVEARIFAVIILWRGWRGARLARIHNRRADRHNRSLARAEYNPVWAGIGTGREGIVHPEADDFPDDGYRATTGAPLGSHAMYDPTAWTSGPDGRDTQETGLRGSAMSGPRRYQWAGTPVENVPLPAIGAPVLSGTVPATDPSAGTRPEATPTPPPPATQRTASYEQMKAAIDARVFAALSCPEATSYDTAVRHSVFDRAAATHAGGTS